MTMVKWIAGTTLAVLVSCAATNLARADEVENVTLWDKDGTMGVTVSQKDLKAGKVTFNVTNSPDSTVEHEMIVVLLTPDQVAHPNALPYDENAAKVEEEQIDDRGEVSELDPGQSGSLTLNLKPGTYMLLCNVAGHYKAGMYTIVHVS